MRCRNFQRSPEQSVGETSNIGMACGIYPGRRSLSWKGLVRHQGKFTIVSFTTPVQVLLFMYHICTFVMFRTKKVDWSGNDCSWYSPAVWFDSFWRHRLSCRRFLTLSFIEYKLIPGYNLRLGQISFQTFCNYVLANIFTSRCCVVSEAISGFI